MVEIGKLLSTVVSLLITGWGAYFTLFSDSIQLRITALMVLMFGLLWVAVSLVLMYEEDFQDGTFE